MAGPADFREKQDFPAPLPSPTQTTVAEIEADDVRATAARLYGSGYTRKQVYRILFEHLAPAKRPGKRDRTLEERQNLARKKLRSWEKSETFRDMVYETARIHLDLRTPKILEGVAKKAERGRVDAARLALEVTGRHNPRGEQQAPNITVQIANIPRPASNPTAEAPEVVEGEAKDDT